jgi:TolA-binding protein
LQRDQQIAELLKRNQEMEEEIQRLRELVRAKGKAKGSKKPRFRLDYSVEGGQRRSKRGKQATGRYPQAQKLAQVSATEALYPQQVNPKDCVFRRQQCVWRIIDGKAQYVCYTIYAPAESEA